jgi:hypothetical protein
MVLYLYKLLPLKKYTFEVKMIILTPIQLKFDIYV